MQIFSSREKFLHHQESKDHYPKELPRDPITKRFQEVAKISSDVVALNDDRLSENPKKAKVEEASHVVAISDDEDEQTEFPYGCAKCNKSFPNVQVCSLTQFFNSFHLRVVVLGVKGGLAFPIFGSISSVLLINTQSRFGPDVLAKSWDPFA